MKVIRKLFFCLLALSLVWVGIYTYNCLTDGFNIHQMTSSLPAQPAFHVPLESEKKIYLQTLLNQKFQYVGKGCQFYVFASEDGQCVIKFLKHKHLRPFTWLKAVPLPQKWRALCDAKIERRAERVSRLFSSCKLAYEKMPEETALLFIHINRVPALDKKVTLIDKMGLKHTIEIDEYEYFIQRKITPLKAILASGENSDELPHTVQKLSDLLSARCRKGIRDRDRSFVQNVGFLDEKAFFMDFGQFYEDPVICQEEEQIKEIKKRLHNLQAWIKDKYPSYDLCSAGLESYTQ